MTRQAVYSRMQRRGLALRERIAPLPFVVFNGEKYTVGNKGYLRKTNGSRELLHRAMWRKKVGPIPKGFDVHHKDENKTHNALSNFECLSKSDHTHLYSPLKKSIVPKKCVACDVVMPRRVRNNHSESPFRYARRKTCGEKCAADWKKGKTRGSRMPR